MQIKLWKNFSKRAKSTKRPNDNEATIIQAKLKEATSVEAPTFTILGNDTDYNYAYAFGQYYTIEDTVQNTNGTCDIVCAKDLLATWKTNVGSYTGHIARSASNINKWISDPLVNATDEIVYSATSEGNLLTHYTINGQYVVKCTGAHGINTFVLSEQTIKNVFNTAFGTETHFDTVTEAIQSLFRAIGSPSQYVHSIKWFPFDNVSSSSTEYAYFGWFRTAVPANLANKAISATAIVPIPYSSGTTIYYGDWRDYDSRFVTASIYLPGFGQVSIDPKYLKDQISVWYDIDIETGTAQIQLVSGSSWIATYTGTAGVEQMFAGLSGLGEIPGIIKTASALTQVNPYNPITPIGTALNGFAKGISDGLNPPASIVGSAGNRSMWQRSPWLRCTITVLGSGDLPTATAGGPCNKNAQISTLSGYVQTEAANVSIPSHGGDRDQLNALLNSGFYYE